MKTAYILPIDIDPENRITTNLDEVNMIYIRVPKLKRSPTNLPKSLHLLNFEGCKLLTELVLPEKLGFLNLTGCDALEFNEELKQQLTELSSEGCQITYPNESKEIEKTKARLVAFKEQNKFSPHTYSLFNFYLTESLDQRDKQYSLAKNLFALLEILEKSPEHLNLVEDIATKFIGHGCVNQPVAGFFEIASWLMVASAKSQQEKLEALTPLIANHTIIHCVVPELKLGKVAENFEVEIGNILVGKVCEKLFKKREIAALWFGSARKVANEKSDPIKPFLTERNFNLAYERVLKEIQAPLQERVGRFLDNSENIHLVGQILFPQEFQKIQTQYAKLREPLENMIGEELTTKNRDLNLQERVDISDKIKQLTSQLIPDTPSSITRKASGSSLKESANQLG